jgi:hypothetical protein
MQIDARLAPLPAYVGRAREELPVDIDINNKPESVI